MITRTARRIGNSIVATLPATLVNVLDIKEGDILGMEMPDITRICITKYAESKKGI